MTDTNPLAAIEALADDWAAKQRRNRERFVDGAIPMPKSPHLPPPETFEPVSDLRAALDEAREAVGALVAERDRLRDTIAQSDRSHLVLIEHLLAALGISDETTDEETAALLGGCDCNGEDGSRHLLWHLICQRDAAREALARVAGVLREWGALANDGDFVTDDDFAEAISEDGAWRLARDLRAALAQPATDEDAGQ